MEKNTELRNAWDFVEHTGIGIFLTGTAAKITPVRRLETTDLATQRPVMNALREKLNAITEGREPAYEHWVTRIVLSET